MGSAAWHMVITALTAIVVSAALFLWLLS